MASRILILQPVRDENTVRREVSIRTSPVLREHIFEYIYATEPVSLDETQPMLVRMQKSQQGSLDDRGLLKRLDECVESFQPDILIVHSGAAFDNSLNLLWSILQVVKTSHPGLRIGFQPRAFERYIPKPFLEYTTEMRDLMSTAFEDHDGKKAIKPENK